MLTAQRRSSTRVRKPIQRLGSPVCERTNKLLSASSASPIASSSAVPEEVAVVTPARKKRPNKKASNDNKKASNDNKKKRNRASTATATSQKEPISSSLSSKDDQHVDDGGSNQKAKKKSRLSMTATATENDPPHRRKNDVVTTVEVDVDLPASIVHSDDFWTRTIVRHYRHTASYWPVVLPVDPSAALASIETCLAAHRYYMAGLQFAGPTTAAADEAAKPQPNLWILTESAAATPNVGRVSCLGGDEIMPFDYLNLVHCLPYGESWLLSGGHLNALTKTERLGMKNGTVAFWKLLAVLAGRLDVATNEDDDPLDRPHDCFNFLTAKANRDDRLRDKKDILSRLKERRIALVDASLAPIFKGGNRTFHKNKTTGLPYYTSTNYLKAHKLTNLHFRTCWTYYAKIMIEQHRPRHVLILSKTLERAIGKDEILNTVQAYGGRYHDVRIHPSTTLTNEKRAIELMAIREIVQQSTRERGIIATSFYDAYS